ncbi:MAG: TfoX/Sxy family protein [Ahrensia sp.]|nr:TfoX/Sxy family protein [Ahrensia sp.]
MAFDEETTARFRDALGGMEGIAEKRMMGGTCFMLDGNMLGGASRAKAGQRRFMFRIGKDNVAKGDDLPGGQRVVMGKRPMNGFFHVDADECSDDLLKRWLSLALEFNAELPPK